MQYQETQVTEQKAEEIVTYETPAIIYEGEISTRAGSPVPIPDIFDSAQPDIFGD
ncbi:MAG: hypothetical protein KDE51_08075 [Anaerolineales bacterium]|nr:hypothetical protein [Anaerolineales bacterium]